MEELQSAGVPAGASFSAHELVADRHLAARRFFVEVTDDQGVARGLPGLPWRWADGDAPRLTAAPGLGQHTDAVLRNVLELSPDEIEELRAADALT